MMTLFAGNVATPTPSSDSLQEARPGQASPWPARIGWALVFAALFACVQYLIDPRILYHAYLVLLPGGRAHIVFPEFFLGWEFFETFTALPGGLTEYLGAMASQFFFYPFVGAAILAAVGLGVFVFAAGIARQMGLRYPHLMGLAPVLVLVAIWGRYTFHLADQLALLGALAWVRLYVAAPRSLARTVGFILFAPVLYVVVGGPYVLAAAMCGLFELLDRRKKIPGIICLALGAAVPWLVGVEVLGAGATDAYGRLTGLLPIERIESDRGPWEMLLAAALGATLLWVVAGRWAIQQLIGDSQGPVRNAPRPRRRWHDALAVALIIIGAGAAVACFDHQARRVLNINCYARTGQWTKALAEAATCWPGDMSTHTRRQVNWALFESDEMGSRMFAFPQRPDGLLPNPMMDDIVFGAEETLLALGAVNQAEHLAAEALMVRGPTPHILTVLAKAFIAKGEPQAARIFLTRLERDLIHGRWARRCLERLDRDPTFSDDPAIRHIRSVMPKRDVLDTGDLEANLKLLLDANPGNRMAFEYLSAHYLLNWRLDDLAARLETSLPDISYQTLPDHYGEAMVIRSSQKPLPNLHGFHIPPDVFQRAQQFNVTTQAHRHDADALSHALEKDFPHSYFRYHRTGRSGGMHP